jgi:hypothetical protein
LVELELACSEQQEVLQPHVGAVEVLELPELDEPPSVKLPPELLELLLPFTAPELPPW